MPNFIQWACLLGVCVCFVEAGIMMSPTQNGGAAIQAALDEDVLIRAACNSRCGGVLTPGESVCYIAHPFDCFKFIICSPLPRSGGMYIQIMPCAFGTMWKSEYEGACERADLVACRHDPCRAPNTTVYDNDDINCRTHYVCDQGRSMPGCCGRYQRFDSLTETCVNDISCDAACPLVNDVTCQGPGVTSLYTADGNCRSYSECIDGRPYPACCPDGFGYDVFTSACMQNASCTDLCQAETINNCSVPTVAAYTTFDNPNCRTYMKCTDTVPRHPEPFCCRSGMMFDKALQTCVDATTRSCINERCPLGYKEECRLKAIPGNPNRYKHLDTFGGNEMPCPVGTVFMQKMCQCGIDPTQTPVVPGVGECKVVIHAIMPDLKNNGSAVAALLMIGKHGQGESGVGNMTTFWDGKDGINIPYFGSQAPSNLYIEISLRPARKPQGPPTVRQVLVTSCEYIGTAVSLEISLMAYQNNTGLLTTRLATPGVSLGTVIDMPYTENQEYTYKLIYNGSDLAVVLAPINQLGMGPMTRSQQFAGSIPIYRSGLRLAKCRYEKGVSGFVGYISEIKISKCLTPEMQQELAILATRV